MARRQSLAQHLASVVKDLITEENLPITRLMVKLIFQLEHLGVIDQ